MYRQQQHCQQQHFGLAAGVLLGMWRCTRETDNRRCTIEGHQSGTNMQAHSSSGVRWVLFDRRRWVGGHSTVSTVSLWLASSTPSLGQALPSKGAKLQAGWAKDWLPVFAHDMLPHDAQKLGQPAQMAQAAPPLPDRSVTHSQINAAHGPGPSLLDLPEGVIRLLLQLLRGSPNRLALRCVCKHLKRLTDGLPCHFSVFITLPSQPEETIDVANQSELGSLHHTETDMLSAAAHEQVMQQLATFPRCCNLVQLGIAQCTGGCRSHQMSYVSLSTRTVSSIAATHPRLETLLLVSLRVGEQVLLGLRELQHLRYLELRSAPTPEGGALLHQVAQLHKLQGRG